MINKSNLFNCAHARVRELIALGWTKPYAQLFKMALTHAWIRVTHELWEKTHTVVHMPSALTVSYVRSF